MLGMRHMKIIYITGIFMLNQALADNSTLSENTTSASNAITPLYVPVYSIEYNVVQDKLPELLFDLMYRYPYNTFIKSEDVLNMLSFQNLEVPPKLTEINFEKLLNVSNVSINEIRATLTTYIPPRKITNLRRIIEGFNIDFDDFQEYVLEDDDFHLLQLLRTGNYTDDSIQYALNIMSKSENEILEIIWPIFFRELVNVPVPELLTTFDVELMCIFSDVNTTSPNILQNPALTLMLKNFTDTLNNETIWSTATSIKELVTILIASTKIQPFKEFINIYVKNIENDTIFLKGNISKNGMLSIINVESLEAYIDKASNYSTDFDGCYYVSQSKAENVSLRSIENALFENNLIITSSENGFTQNLGAPLVCDNLLYGFLIDQNETNWIYYSFKEIVTATPVTSGGISILESTTTQLSVGISSASGRLYLNIVLAIATKSIIFMKM